MEHELIESIHDAEQTILLEALAKVLRFEYERAKTDPTPRILTLGRFKHPNTKNNILCGINLNYLDKTDIQTLKQHIPDFIKAPTLRKRYWLGRKALPNIWFRAYRQYDEQYIHGLKQAEIIPDIEDYKEPTQPGQEPPDEQAQKTIAKLKKIEAEKEDEPPKNLRQRIARFSKDTISRLANFIKKKLGVSKPEKPTKPEKPKPLEEPDEPEAPQATEIADDELIDIEDVDTLEDDETQEKPQDDDTETKESTTHQLNAIIETLHTPTEWTTEDYIHWHTPTKFFQYNPKIQQKPCNAAQGNKFIITYNIQNHTTIMDFQNDPTQIILNTGWDPDHLITFIIDHTLTIQHHPKATPILEHLQQTPLWELIQHLTK